MTLGEFFAYLSVVAYRFDWRITPQGMVRGTIIGASADVCPLTAVKYMQSGLWAPMAYAVDTAVAYGMTEMAATEVQCAADNSPIALQDVTERLLTAVGLFV